jgi:wyosine [tRNA(Phe)-imidazoG37] synthetase (radical SAM superfamily)
MPILFNETVFGPVNSRRLGVSLGINLLPVDYKFCSFNCIYCECGWTGKGQKKKYLLPKRAAVKRKLEQRLNELKESGPLPEAITFAGNGEPTLHPQFAGIMEDTITLRDRYFPEAAISVLSNASMLHKPEIFEALKKADKNILKLDAGTEESFQLINNPKSKISLREIVDKLKEFDSNLFIQTLFLRGTINGIVVDNTLDDEFFPWLELVKEIRPQMVMIYPIDRQTPVETLERIPFEELKILGAHIEAEGIKTQVFS